MIVNIIQINYACFIVCGLMIIFLLADRSFNRKTTTLFLVTVGLILCISLSDTFELIEEQLAYPTFLRRFCSAIGYSLRPLLPIMFTRVVQRNSVTSPTKEKTVAETVICALLSLNAIASFVSIFTDCMFGFSERNIFFRGPIGFLPFVVAAVCVVYMIVVTRISMQTPTINEKAIIVMIVILCVVGTIIESSFRLNGILNISCAIGTAFYYLYIHVNIYSRDQLTNAYSRRIFYLDIDKLAKRSAVVVEIDLNGLKKINDAFGHSEGDNALVTLSGIIHKCVTKSCSVYRTGGDEFVILCRKTDASGAETIVHKIREKIELTPYSFAYGIAQYNKDTDIESVMEDADKRMYAMKKNMKMNIC